VPESEELLSMTRTLLVFRHGKSDWPEGVPDAKRPLGTRGRRDAPAAGAWLVSAGLRPDLVISSPAVRARETWELAATALDEAPPVSYDKRVYAAPVPRLLEVLRDTPDDVQTLVLVGHNPGLQELVDALADDGDPDALDQVREKFPTSAIAKLSFDGSWADMDTGSARLDELIVPRG
jgi:phosphohistidine phosphatase